MTKATIAIGALAAVLGLVILVVFVAGHRAFEPKVDPATAISLEVTSATEAAGLHEGFLYGRITTDDGATYEGRLRWAGDEEALWGHHFNGWKAENPWASHVAPERLMRERPPIEIFGLEIAREKRPIDLGRPFMVRFGDITRIEAEGRDLRVTLKSGTVFHLDRFEADDLADGVRVWDARSGIVDLGERRIRTIELFRTAQPGAAPDPLYGTVRTPQGEFTGLLQWNREECVGADELDGRTADGEVSLRFDTIRSIARHSPDSSLVTLLDDRQIVLSDTREVGQGNRGVYVDDRRYGRVLVPWNVSERVDFSPDGGGPGGSGPAGSGPAYDDFPPGRPLTGSVTTRFGHRLAGRLVYDLDESETTETLDAPSRGVNYTIPFGLIATILPPGREEGGARRARVTLHSGEELQLEPTGDLGEGNAGMLIFIDGQERPEYVPWTDVEQVDLDPPPAMYPPSQPR